MEANSTTAFFNRPFFRALIAEKVLRDAQLIATGSAQFRLGVTGDSLQQELSQAPKGAYSKISAVYETADPELAHYIAQVVGQKLTADPLLARKCRNGDLPAMGGLAAAHTYTLYLMYAPFVPASAERVLFPGIEGRQTRKSA